MIKQSEGGQVCTSNARQRMEEKKKDFERRLVDGEACRKEIDHRVKWACMLMMIEMTIAHDIGMKK